MKKQRAGVDDLAMEVAYRTGRPNHDLSEIIHLVFDVIKEMAKEYRVVIPGFGSFEYVEKGPRRSYCGFDKQNPYKDVPPRLVLTFSKSRGTTIREEEGNE